MTVFSSRKDMSGLHELGYIEEVLLTLNRRLTHRAFSAALGEIPTASDYGIYEEYEGLLRPEIIVGMRDAVDGSKRARRIFYTLLGHYLQYQSIPYENELSTWMRGATADIRGEKIYLKDVHSWCQKRSDLVGRRLMEKETSSLSKFLKPFALSPWENIVGILEEEFGYEDYVAYCEDKKRPGYASWAASLAGLLEKTGPLYFREMEEWVRTSLGIPLSEANRFDAIYLVGLGEFDRLYPEHIPLTEHLRFFSQWGMDVPGLTGLHLLTEYSPRKTYQGVTFALTIPEDIRVVMNSQGGWIDLETLFHEMGHALSNLFTSTDLPPFEKDFNTSSTLSEAYAFLIQNMCFEPPFLQRQLRLTDREIEIILHYKNLKDMAFFRRYAAKFLAEYRVFREKALGDGRIYASTLEEHTGFSYKPETQLFDLAPELYSLDYVKAWMAEVSMAKALSGSLGPEWMFKREAGEILKAWWRNGNREELEGFLLKEGIGAINASDITDRWTARIGGIHPQ
jgi:hypothetical protein